MKKGGLLERIVKSRIGICETCSFRLDIGSELGYGCEVHDKLILKDFPPYFQENNPCPDWEKKEAKEVEV